MKKLFKTKFGNIPVIIRNDVPEGEIYFVSNEVDLESFDNLFNTPQTSVPKANFIRSFKKKLNPRRFGKITNIK